MVDADARAAAATIDADHAVRPTRGATVDLRVPESPEEDHAADAVVVESMTGADQLPVTSTALVATRAAGAAPILKAEAGAPGPNPSVHGNRQISTRRGRTAQAKRTNVPRHAPILSPARDPGLARDLRRAASPGKGL